MTERRHVAFDVYGVAQPKGSTKAFVPYAWAKTAVAQGRAPRAIVVADNKAAAKGWQRLIADQAQTVAAGGIFLGAVTVAITFDLPRPLSLRRKTRHHTTAPDVDKLARTVLDALTGILYLDDKQVVELHARKRYILPPAGPHARIAVDTAADADIEQPDWIDTFA
jgi:Holliday junction resolvase RusA-like endonuclease